MRRWFGERRLANCPKVSFELTMPEGWKGIPSKEMKNSEWELFFADMRDSATDDKAKKNFDFFHANVKWASCCYGEVTCYEEQKGHLTVLRFNIIFCVKEGWEVFWKGYNDAVIEQSSFKD